MNPDINILAKLLAKSVKAILKACKIVCNYCIPFVVSVLRRVSVKMFRFSMMSLGGLSDFVYMQVCIQLMVKVCNIGMHLLFIRYNV